MILKYPFVMGLLVPAVIMLMFLDPLELRIRYDFQKRLGWRR